MYIENKSKSRIKTFKIAVLIFLFIVIGLGVFIYVNIFWIEGTGPAGPSVPLEPFKKVWSDKQICLLGIGDSITDGFGVPKGFSYFERLIDNPMGDVPDMIGKNLTKVFPNIVSKNISVSGSNSLRHYERQIKTLNIMPKDVFGIIVMTTGGNDIVHNYGRSPPEECAMYGAGFEQAKPWIQNFEKRLLSMIAELNTKFPGGCQIFIATIYDPSDGTGDTTKWFTGLPKWKDGGKILKAYNDAINKISQENNNVHIVNIHDAFLGHGLRCRVFWNKNYNLSDPYYWYNCGILEDPNIRGYDAIRRLFLLEMVKVFSGNQLAQN